MAAGTEKSISGKEVLANSLDKAEIIVYESDDQSVMFDVRIEDETVWLTQAQMTELFNSSKQNIGLHVNNIFKEG